MLSEKLVEMAARLVILPRWRYPLAKEWAARLRAMSAEAGLLEMEHRRMTEALDAIVADARDRPMRVAGGSR